MEVDKIDTGKTFPEVEMLWYSEKNIVNLAAEKILSKMTEEEQFEYLSGFLGS